MNLHDWDDDIPSKGAPLDFGKASEMMQGKVLQVLSVLQARPFGHAVCATLPSCKEIRFNDLPADLPCFLKMVNFRSQCRSSMHNLLPLQNRSKKGAKPA